MKYILLLAAILFAGYASSVNAASCPSYPGEPCAGGAPRGYNVVTKSWEMIPQCFPFVTSVEFYKGNIFDMYVNQRICRANRLEQFGY